MTERELRGGTWRITVVGAVTPLTASLLDDLHVSVVETTTLLESDGTTAGCAGTIASLQSCGFEVVEVHWSDRLHTDGPNPAAPGS